MSNNNTSFGKKRRDRSKRSRGHAKRPQQKQHDGGNLIRRPNPRFPGDIKQVPIQSRAIRYVNISNVLTDQAVTPRDLLRQLSAVVSGSTAVTAIIGSVRLRRISMYFVPPSNDFTSSSSISLQWQGVTNGPEYLITDRGTATLPACIKVRPPLDSVAGFWFDENSPQFTSSLLTLSCPVGTIFDFDFDYTIQEGAGHTGTLTSAAAFSGVVITTMLGAGMLTPDGGVNTKAWT